MLNRVAMLPHSVTDPDEYSRESRCPEDRRPAAAYSVIELVLERSEKSGQSALQETLGTDDKL